MSFRSFTSALSVTFVLTCVGFAAADVPPPDGYVEECTVANVQSTTSECVQCYEDHMAQVNRCGVLLAPYCYTRVCGAWGGEVFTALWCRTKSADAPAVPDAIASQLYVFPITTVDAASVPPLASTCAAYTAPVVVTTSSSSSHGGASSSSGVPSNSSSRAASSSGGTSSSAGSASSTGPASSKSQGGCSVREGSEGRSLLVLAVVGLGFGLSLRRRRPSR